MNSMVGVDVRSLPPGAALTVDTVNSSYRIVVLDGKAGRALMQGGRVFPTETEVRIEGSTVEDDEPKPQWIGVGLRMEFGFHGKHGVTSTVRAINLETLQPDGGPPVQ